MRRAKSARRGFALAAVLLVLSAIVAACGSGGPGGEGVGVVTIGGVFEESGALVTIGIPEQQGSELAVDQVNNGGGFTVAGKKYKLQLEQRNNDSSPVPSVNAVRQFITQDNLKFIIGPSYAVAATPTFAVTQNAHVLQFTVATTAGPLLGKPGYPYLFRMLDADAARAGTMPEIVKQKTGISSIAVLSPDNELGHLKATEFAKGFEAIGVKVTGTFISPPDTTDFSSVLLKVAAGKPDAIFMGGWPDAATSQIIRQSLEANMTNVFIQETGASLAAGQPYKNQLKWYSLTTYSVDPTGSSAGAKEYAALYQKKFGKAPAASSYAGPMAYDTVRMLVAAMEKAGTTTDVDKIRDALHGLHFNGLVPELITNTGQLVNAYEMSALQNGQQVQFPVTLDQVERAAGS